ncbi:GNAT family N-acetyltransferase [Brevundimonas sp.]|uniref:GNAT family N-acetyltransferase n=1 Tax=Brevundimonas sp. TaxID=1871086 RepID=UPI00248A4789|nr:GNAT family N-acetyltransferase [Brevundimonas sp.]MDI1282562.1 GNAT family N-acetyltransferase [Brevundimonas sp.]
MSDLIDRPGAMRFEQAVTAPDGTGAMVWADYAVQGSTRSLLHVEADPALRGSGAAGRFMQALADHARAEGLSLAPRCSYAVAWFKRNPDQGDVLAS